jgi:hypothetical protein
MKNPPGTVERPPAGINGRERVRTVHTPCTELFLAR